MRNIGIAILSIVLFIIVVFTIMMMIPSSRVWIREYIFQLEVVDQETNYENRRLVEDTARAMISNYEAYKQEYDTYKDFAMGTTEYQRALDAKTAANRVVSNYNNYLTQNNFIWAGNLPADIPNYLIYIE